MEGYTNFTKVYAPEVKSDAFVGPITGDVTGDVTGNLEGDLTDGKITASDAIEKATDYILSNADKNNVFLQVAMTAADKTLTLGLTNSQIIFIHNSGSTNAFTIKNIAGDTGTSLAAGKIAIVRGFSEANLSTVLVLN